MSGISYLIFEEGQKTMNKYSLQRKSHEIQIKEMNVSS
jgi:hypothetical protein